MYILRIIDPFFPGGGAQKYVLQLSEASKKYGITTILITNIKHQNSDYSKKLIDNNIEVIYVDFSYNPLKIHTQVKEIKNKLKSKKIFFIASHLRKADILGYVLSRKLKIKQVITLHGHISSLNFNNGFSYKEKLLSFVHRYIINSSFGVIANSKYTLDINNKLYSVSNKNSIVIYNGIEKLANLNTFKKEDSFIITQIGIGIGVKNSDILIEYFKQLNLKYPNLELRLVGNAGSERNFQELKTICKEHNDIKLIEHTDDIGSLISTSNAVVVFATQEGFGRTIIESFQMNTSVIAWNEGAPTELISHQKDGFLIKNYQEFEQAIKTIKEDKQMISELTNKAQKKYKDNFSLNIFEENIFGQYKKWRLI